MRPAGERLAQKVEAVRVHLARRAAAAAALWVAAGAAAVLVASWLLVGPEGWRQGSALPLALDLGALLAAAGLVLGVHGGKKRWLAEARLVRAMEESAGVPRGLVQGAMELSRSLPDGVSETLVDRAAGDAADALARAPGELAGALGASARRWGRRGAWALAALAGVEALLGVVSPTRAGKAWSGLAAPLRVAAAPVFGPLSVSPGSAEVPWGSDVEVQVVAPGRSAADVAWRAAGDVPRVEPLRLRGGVGVKVFRALSTAVEYEVRTPDGARSGTFRLVPVAPLFVGDLRVEISYPPHTRLPPEEHRGVIPPLRLPQGTRLLIEGSLSRAASRASLLDGEGGTALELSIGEGRFAGVWHPSRSGSYPWCFVDERGGAAAAPPDPLRLEVVADAAPDVSIPIPGRDTVLALSGREPLVLEASDDYGLSRLELVAYRVSALGAPGEPLVQGIDLGGMRAALARPLLDVSAWGLLPGDEVRYFARAVDNAPIPRTSRTREFSLRMAGAPELRRGAGEALAGVADKLRELAAEAARKAEEARHLQRGAATRREDAAAEQAAPGARGDAGFDEREAVRKAVGDQKSLSAEVDSLGAELAALQKALEDAGQADPSLRDDLAELRRLLEEIAGEDLEKRVAEIARGLDGEDARERSRALADLAKEQEALRDRLEESLERFRRAAVAQDFRATRTEMDELAGKERALAGAMREADRPALREEQQVALEREVGAVEGRMRVLEERLAEIREARAAAEVATARDESAQAGERMRDAGEEARRGARKEAGERGEQAADRLTAAAERLARAEEEMARDASRATRDALLRAADGALALARRQSALRASMGATPRESLPSLRGDESSLAQGVRNLAQAVQASTEGILGANRGMAAQLGRALDALDRVIETLGGGRSVAAAPMAAAEQATGELNRLAVLALEGARGAAGGEGGERGGETAEELQDLAQRQGEMVNRTGQLTPLQLGERALAEQLERLAEDERSVSEELHDLSRKDQARDEALGDLDRLAAEAAAVAEALGKGRLTPETMERQERLFHRLLDAGRTLERDEDSTSDQRESRTAGAFERAEVVPLDAARMGALRFGLPSADELRRLSPAVRQLVLEYFERLNRVESGGSSR